MANDSIKIINAETGEEIEREMTDEEQALRTQQVTDYLAEKAAKAEAKLETENNKMKLLDKLGITADEAALLLGGN
jgi:hypothetical protein